jgi:hypothetical protein
MIPAFAYAVIVTPQVCRGLDSKRETRGMYLLDSGRWDVHKGGPADKVGQQAGACNSCSEQVHAKSCIGLVCCVA